MDSFSPLAPARVLVQVLPVGPVSSSTFDKILTNLTRVGVLLMDNLKVSEDAGRNDFKASALPNGKLSFHFSTATRLPSTALLYPFETFREPFVILGVADLARLDPRRLMDEAGSDGESHKHVDEELKGFAAQLQENYPSALLHRVLAIDVSSSLSDSTSEIVPILPEEDLKPLLLDIGGRLLPELGGLARSFQALQTFSSPLARDGGHASGYSTPNAAPAGRRGSLQPIESSQTATDLKASHRMSMPAHLINSSPNRSPGPRSESPLRGGRASPATTFDDIPGAVPPQVIARMSTPTGARDSSADRAPTSGFGSDTLNERNRLKQQGRLACVVGSLYLQAGLWSDALRELSDCITKARSCSDYLWHAKAYENSILCLLLLAWNGVYFRIPDVCYPSTSRPLAARGPQTPSESTDPVQTPTPESIIEAIKTLHEMLPEMIYMARDLYQRTTKIPEESLTPSAYSETNVRLARLLTGLCSEGQTDSTMFQMMQTNLDVKIPFFRRGRALARQASELLHSAIPPSPDVLDTSATETLSILGAIAACYSALGMARKSALLLQDYLDCLTPSLVQARKLGAAEAGMHPAAGIANFQEGEPGGSTKGLHIDDILEFFECIQLLPPESRINAGWSTDPPDNIDMKLNLLRKCIRVCEALPDFNGILKCTAEFLRLAGPGSAPSLRSPDVHIKVSAEEQAVISSNFYRTSDLMDNLSLSKQGGCYWDRFLIRGLELQPPKQELEMVHYRTTTNNSLDAGKTIPNRGPFLHEAFAQKANVQKPQAVLVAEENRSFSVILQNLYDFEVYIDSIELITSQDDFRPIRRDIRLSPRRVQVFNVSGTPQTPGKVSISGCRVTVKGCATSELRIFRDAWAPPEAVKIFATNSNTSEVSTAHPKPFSLEATILPAQPRLELRGSSLSERALEIHEGEIKTLKIEIYNASKSASINFMKITPQDNISVYLLSALKERDLQPPLRYEIERQLYIEPVLKLNDADLQSLPPLQTKSLQFETLGKPGLTHLTLLLDYAYVEDKDSKSQFLTRVLAVPVTITTRPSLRVASFQLAPLPEDPMSLVAPRESHCWMSLSFQNISTRTMEASVELKSLDGSDRPRQRELVQPNATATISCIVPKIYVEKAYATIPSLDPSKEQQFVVRTSGGAPIDDRDERERFWYGNALINSITATWRDPLGDTSGIISLRDVSLSPMELLTLRLDDLSIFWQGELTGHVATPSIARLKLVNRSDEPLRVELQLHRTLSGFIDRTAGGYLDSQLLSIIKPHSEVIAQSEMTFECKGHYVFIPSVVERAHLGGRQDRPLRAWHGEPSYVTVV